MSEILIRNLDQPVVEQLKARRSRQWPILAGRAEAHPGTGSPADGRAAVAGGVPRLADRVRAALGDRPHADSAALLAEDRAR